jgi:hypothetical protein
LNRVNFITRLASTAAAVPFIGSIIPKIASDVDAVTEIPDFGGGWKWEVELPSGAYEWRIVSIIPFTYARLDKLQSLIPRDLNNVLFQRSRVLLLDAQRVTRMTYNLRHW